MAVQDTDMDTNSKTNTFIISHELPGTAPATAANYGKFFTAPFPCQVVSIREVHTTAGSNGGAVTLVIEKLTGTQASDSGVSCMSSTINLKGTAETVQNAALTATAADLVLQRGDRLNLKDAGTLTAVAGVCVTVELKPLVQ